MTDLIAQRNYAHEQDVGSAMPCVVTAIDLSGDPKVTVRALQTTRIVDLNGEIKHLTALDIAEVPYCYPSGLRFAMFVPPEIGMQGFLVTTNNEVGEAASGQQTVTRTKDRSSGFFVPSGSLSGAEFKGSADWAELRSRGCRVALSDDKVHAQAGNTSLVIGPSGFDIFANGVSLIAALKQMSAHIKKLEELVHPNGMVHGPVNLRLVDQFMAEPVPNRNESGVR